MGLYPTFVYVGDKAEKGFIPLPLWRYLYEHKNEIIINIVLSVLIYSSLFFFDVPVIRIFNKEAALVQTASAALPIFSLSFIPMALNLIFTAFLFSTKRTGAADVIAISRGIVVKALAIFCIPILFGGNAIWIAPFVAETATLVLAIVLSKTSKLVYK